MTLSQKISRILGALKLPIEANTVAQLETYLTGLHKWNKTYNLTAIREVDDMLIKHLADSLAVNPYVQGNRIIDVGTGGGLPGIPLAIINPDKDFTLLDTVGKKVTFLKQMVHTLGLKNAHPVQARVESFEPEMPFDTVITRAFDSICGMLSVTKHLVGRESQFLAMKGEVPTDELANLPKEFKVAHIYPIIVPNLNAERCLVVIQFHE
jgi:16S rRNA (guanine527-N7)-methyltransferase